ncbi:MAG: family 16 glycoside hydrolase, partial [Planctomycetota bacterium]
DALAFTDGRAAAEAMVAVHLLAGDEAVRDYARYWIEHRDENDWREFGLAEELPGILPEYTSAELLYRSDPVTSGKISIDVEFEGVETLWLVVDEDGNNGYDWADWVDSKILVNGEWQTLKDIDWRVAEAGWGRVRINRNAGGSGPISIDGEESQGIGTHAPSQIAWALPEGTTRFTTLAGIDDGGAGQPGAAPRVRFEVRGQKGERQGLGPDFDLAFSPEGAQTERVAALQRLSLDSEGGMMLVHRALEGRLDDEERQVISEKIFNNADPAVRALASEAFVRPDAPELPSLAALMALDSDPHRGREVFLSEKAQCTRCHVYELHGFRQGAELGPELTAIGKKYGADGLFDAILNPSAAIAHGYDTWRVETENGLLYTGFLLADGERVVLKGTNGERHALDAEEIVLKKKQPVSTMPQGLATALQPQELADLVAFLREPAGTKPALGDWQNLLETGGGGIQGWVVHSSDPSVPIEDTWQLQDGVLSTSGRPAGYLRTEAKYTNFQLELEWRFDPAKGAGNSGVLLRLHGEDRVWPKSIEAQLHSANAGDIWNIGEFPMQTDPGRTRGRNTARALPSNEKPLGEWNRYVITLDHGHLMLEVNGEVQNEAAWCSEIPGHIGLQSEGAPIEFRNLR